MSDYPQLMTPLDHLEPVPRRLRAYLANRLVLDTTSAVYVWERATYPHFYIPIRDIDLDLLVDEGTTHPTKRGTARDFSLRVGDVSKPHAVRVFGEDALAGLDAMARVDWDSLDAWFEEDEEIFVHPRDPYTRVDALRSSRTIRVELDGTLLAESSSPVIVFETGLPARYYLDRTAVRFEHLVPSDTETACPYKGRTTGYWSVELGDELHEDLAWAYDFPTRQLLPIAGLVAFYNEKVDISVDGELQSRPQTPFS